MTLFDSTGRTILSRHVGHALLTVRAIGKLPRRHVIFELKCACEETVKIFARAAAIDDCGEVHPKDRPCWKFRGAPTADALIFEPAFSWRNHFTTTEQWEAVP
jgi:hypothetical protein